MHSETPMREIPQRVMCIDATDTQLIEACAYKVKTIVDVLEDGNYVPKYCLRGFKDTMFDVGRFIPLSES